jgi:hypothetical protein
VYRPPGTDLDRLDGTAAEATTGIEPVLSALREWEPNLWRWLQGLEPQIEVYAEHFAGVDQ